MASMMRGCNSTDRNNVFSLFLSKPCLAVIVRMNTDMFSGNVSDCEIGAVACAEEGLEELSIRAPQSIKVAIEVCFIVKSVRIFCGYG